MKILHELVHYFDDIDNITIHPGPAVYNTKEVEGPAYALERILDLFDNFRLLESDIVNNTWIVDEPFEGDRGPFYKGRIIERWNNSWQLISNFKSKVTYAYYGDGIQKWWTGSDCTRNLWNVDFKYLKQSIGVSIDYHLLRERYQALIDSRFGPGVITLPLDPPKGTKPPFVKGAL